MFYLPRICEHCLNPVVRRVLPLGRDLQASRGRHRPGRPGPLPRLADVRLRLPVQEGLLQPPHRQGREVHVLLPAGRGRPARPSARRPASAGCATSGSCCTTPTGSSRRRRPPDDQDLYDAQRGVFLDPHDPEVVRAAERAGIPRDWVAGGAAVAGLGADQQVRGGAAAAPGVPHHADGLVHPAAVAGRRRRPRHRARRRGPRATCSPPSTRCASRSSTSPSCSPPATPPAWTPSCAGSRRCAPTCARSTWDVPPTSRSPRRSA